MELSFCKECKVLLSGKPAAYNVETGELMCSSCADKVLGREAHIVDALYLQEKYQIGTWALNPVHHVILETKATCDCSKPSNHGRYQTA